MKLFKSLFTATLVACVVNGANADTAPQRNAPLTDVSQPLHPLKENAVSRPNEAVAKSQAAQQGGKASAKKAAKVNINKADLKTLQTLDGIGEAKAKAIMDYRTQHGKIKDLAALSKVPGIGEATLAKLKGLVSF